MFKLKKEKKKKTKKTTNRIHCTMQIAMKIPAFPYPT